MYDYELKSIWFSNGNRVEFLGDIAEIIDFPESIVIRLAPESVSDHRNVFGFDYQGNFLWQIPPLPFMSSAAPYVTITHQCGYVDALNRDGRLLKLHPKSGSIVEESVSTGHAPHSRRVPSVRRWI